MTNIWALSDAQRRKDFIRQWRADLAAKAPDTAPTKDLHEMDCRECASEEYAAVVAANLAEAEALRQVFIADIRPPRLSVRALENVGVHVPLSAIAPPSDI